MCVHEARLKNIGIFNKTNSVMFEPAVCKCAPLTENQCFQLPVNKSLDDGS